MPDNPAYISDRERLNLPGFRRSTHDECLQLAGCLHCSATVFALPDGRLADPSRMFALYLEVKYHFQGFRTPLEDSVRLHECHPPTIGFGSLGKQPRASAQEKAPVHRSMGHGGGRPTVTRP